MTKLKLQSRMLGKTSNFMRSAPPTPAGGIVWTQEESLKSRNKPHPPKPLV
jgi:hypothetical protein